MVNKLNISNHEVFKAAYIGVCFMILFPGYNTLSNLQKIFLESTKKENPSYRGDGYTSLAVVNVAFAGFLWFVPSIISVIGVKLTLIIGSLGYSVLIASFLTESAWFLYVGSVSCGLGSAMIWNSQGTYMVRVSTKATLTRNLAIFSILLQSGMFYGNIYAYIKFEGKEHMDKSTRRSVVYVLLGISLAATVVMFFLPDTEKTNEGESITQDHIGGPITAIKKTFEIATTTYYLKLFISFVHMGLQMCFMSGVLGACVGFTKQLDHSQQLVPAVGLIVGVGEIFAECLLIGTGKLITSWKWGQSLTITIALVVQYIAFLLIFLNFPNNSVFGDTYDSAIITPSWVVAVVVAFLIGVGDGTLMSMLPAMVGMLYPEDCVNAMALYHFSYSVFSAVGFFLSNYVSLHWQLLGMTVTGTLGALCYIRVSLEAYERGRSTKTPTDIN